MKYQKPAVGIMQTADFKKAKSYNIACECNTPDHAANMWIELNGDAECKNVELSFFVETWTPYWDSRASRWRAIWQLLTQGYVKTEHHMILNRQAAINLAETINHTIKEIEK